MLKGHTSDQRFGLFLSDSLGSLPTLVGEEGNSFLCHQGAITTKSTLACCLHQAFPSPPCVCEWPAYLTCPLRSLSERSHVSCCCETKNPASAHTKGKTWRKPRVSRGEGEARCSAEPVRTVPVSPYSSLLAVKASQGWGGKGAEQVLNMHPAVLLKHLGLCMDCSPTCPLPPPLSAPLYGPGQAKGACDCECFGWLQGIHRDSWTVENRGGVHTVGPAWSRTLEVVSSHTSVFEFNRICLQGRKALWNCDYGDHTIQTPNQNTLQGTFPIFFGI